MEHHRAAQLARSSPRCIASCRGIGRTFDASVCSSAVAGPFLRRVGRSARHSPPNPSDGAARGSVDCHTAYASRQRGAGTLRRSTHLRRLDCNLAAFSVSSTVTYMGHTRIEQLSKEVAQAISCALGPVQCREFNDKDGHWPSSVRNACDALPSRWRTQLAVTVLRGPSVENGRARHATCGLKPQRPPSTCRVGKKPLPSRAGNDVREQRPFAYLLFRFLLGSVGGSTCGNRIRSRTG